MGKYELKEVKKMKVKVLREALEGVDGEKNVEIISEIISPKKSAENIAVCVDIDEIYMDGGTVFIKSSSSLSKVLEEAKKKFN